MTVRLAYVSQGNIPSLWAHTVQAMKMAEAFSTQVDEFQLITQISGAQTRRPEIDLWRWYGIRTPFDVIRLPGERPNRQGLFEKAWYPEFDLAAAAHCAEWHPDLVFTRSPKAARACVAEGLQTVVESHADTTDRHVKVIAETAGDPRLLGVVTITEELAEHYAAAGIPVEKIHVFPDAVDLDSFSDTAPVGDLRREMGVAADDFVVTYCGHLYEDKGIDTVVECAALLPRARFLVVGGWDRDVRRLRRRTRKLRNLELRGFVPNETVPTYLALSDVLVMPYTGSARNSGRLSPLKLFEYMAAGRAIVASDLPSLREHLQDGCNARLVPPDDPTALARTIADLQNDPIMRAELGATARSDVAPLTWKARARDILDAVGHPSLDRSSR